jgi:hypothetical protein
MSLVSSIALIDAAATDTHMACSLQACVLSKTLTANEITCQKLNKKKAWQ